MTYREIMQKEGREIEPIVYYYENNELISISRDDFISSKIFFNASLVGTIMNGMNLELKKELPNKEIFLKIVATYGINTAEKIYGPYSKKEDATYNADSKSYTHNLYDKFLTTMVDYKPITITYPTTVLDFFLQLCKECNFTTNITELPNGSKVINSDIYDGINFTYRDVFTDIGQATATLFKIENTEIIKCELGSLSVKVDDDTLKNQNIDFGEHYGPINSIVLSRSADSDSIYKRDEKLTSWNEFKISDNQLMNDNNRSEYLEEIYKALYGIEYDIFDCQLVGYGGFDALEKIEIQTLGEDGNLKSYNSYVFNNEQTITQGYSETIYTELPSKINTNYKASDTTDRRINQAYILVDKQNQKIEAVVTTQEDQSSKITKLEQTDAQIKASVESIDKQIIPTASVSGSNIYVEDASDDPLIQLEIEGKNTQETRNGKNILENKTKNTGVSNGITFTLNEDGTYTINGTNDNNGNSTVFLSSSSNKTKLSAGTYYTIPTSLYGVNITGYTGTEYISMSSETLSTFTLTEDTEMQVYLQVFKGVTTTFNNEIIYPMVSTTAITKDDYEQYGVSPSPNYPSEIESVGYENLFDNIFRQGDAGSSNVTNRLYSRNDTIVKTNKIYTVNTNLDTSIYRYAINISTESFPNYNHTYDSGWKTTSSFTFNSSIDGYFGIVVSKIDNSTITPDELENAWFVLSKSTQQHSYIPYGKYGVEVEIAGRNKLKGLETAVSDNNYWFNTTQPYFTPLEDGWGKFDYDNTNGTSTVFINAKVKLSAVELKENTTYTIVTEIRNSNISENSGTFFQIVTANPTIAFQQARSLGYSNINQGGIFKTTSTTKESFDAVECAIDTYLRLAARTKGTVEARISIFEDDVDITNFVYEEYKSNISVFELDQPLRSLPNGVKDIAYIKNNKLYVDRYVGSVVLDGSEGWKDDWQNSSFTDYIQFYLPSSFLNNNYVIYKMSNPNAFCNCFKLLETVWSYEGEFIALNPNTTYTLQVKMLITDIPDLATFKEWLSTHNTQVDYELATPITEEIGGIKMPSTFKGVNHISTTDGLEPTINIEYVRDTILSNYVEGQISNLKTIEERHYSELVVEDENIKASVSETQSSLDGTISNMNKLESNLTSQSATLEIISTNIDKTTGEVREVTTTNGLKFNSDGINLYNGEDSYNTLIDNVGTYYKDGDTVISETTKDGFMATNSKNKGQHSYSYDDTNNIYEFTDERIEVDGEYAYATFYNGEE